VSLLNALMGMGNAWGASAAMEAAAYQQQSHAQQLANMAGLQNAWFTGAVSNTRPAPTRGPPRAPLLPRQSKCPSCGSREWTPHAGKEVCAYCRSDRA
jgi:hypothetical protein